MDRLMQHQKQLEDFFEIFYSVLDDTRQKALHEEYKLRDLMNKYDNVMKKLIHKAQSYDLRDFFEEKVKILNEINSLKADIGMFSNYVPNHEVLIPEDNRESVIEKLKSDIKSKVDKYVIPIDNSFALSNFKYITEELDNPKLKEVYELLGPFDYSKFKEEDDEAELTKKFADNESQKSEVFDDKRYTEEKFVLRSKGAKYRGQMSTAEDRYDGKGFKIHEEKGQLYEGYFTDGKYNGFGRIVSTTGKMFVYEGGITSDTLDGWGFSVTTDG